MKKPLAIISRLVLGMVVLIGCSNNPDNKSKNLSFTYRNIYDQIKDENGNKMACGIWDDCYIDRKIFRDAHVRIPEYFISGDKITLKVEGQYLTQEGCPGNFNLAEGAVISGVIFDFADIVKIKSSDIVKEITGDNVIYTYKSMSVLDTNIITSRDGDFIPFKENTYEDLYVSVNQEKKDGDLIFNVPYGLYSFDPSEINNREIKIRAVAFCKNIVYNEERMLSAKEYDYEDIMFNAFHLNNKNIKSSDFEFVYNKDEFYVEDLYVHDVRDISFMVVPLKIGRFKININAFGYSWILNVNVSKNDFKYDNDIDFHKYDELKKYLDGIKYHEFKNPYPGLTGNKYREGFDEYNTDYEDYLMDSCYYPSYFPSAPKSPIMVRDIEIVGDSDHKLDYGCEKSSIYFMSIDLFQIDPGCTNPMDRVTFASYNMVKLVDVFKFSFITAKKDLVLLKYEQVKPIVYENNGITFYLLRQGDFISAFFKDEKYLYSFVIKYDMSKTLD